MMKKYLFIIAAAYLTSSCSGDDVASNTNFQVIPESPVVINEDYTYNKPPLPPAVEFETVTISGAWFQLQYKFNNDSSEQVTVTNIKFEATGRTPSGAEVTAEYVLNSSELAVNQDADASNNLAYLFTVNAGAQSVSEDVAAKIYIQGLPKTPDVANSSLRVKVTISGWVGSADVPKESFVKTEWFSTQ
jgi:hypothetical protein